MIMMSWWHHDKKKRHAMIFYHVLMNCVCLAFNNLNEKEIYNNISYIISQLLFFCDTIVYKKYCLLTVCVLEKIMVFLVLIDSCEIIKIFWHFKAKWIKGLYGVWYEVSWKIISDYLMPWRNFLFNIFVLKHLLLNKELCRNIGILNDFMLSLTHKILWILFLLNDEYFIRQYFKELDI